MIDGSSLIREAYIKGNEIIFERIMKVRLDGMHMDRYRKVHILTQPRYGQVCFFRFIKSNGMRFQLQN